MEQKYTSETLELYQLIRSHPWYFAKHLVQTKDEVDRVNPIKPFPADLDYIKTYMELWLRYPKIAVPKSRRMIMSWTNLICYLWDTMFHVGRQNAIVSKKEEDSCELLERCKFMLQKFRTDQIPKDLIPRWEYKYGQLSFPELDSKMIASASGADQLRQYTLSGIMADECAFWDDAEETYSASIPTLEGGGRVTMISSPAPGFFQKIVFDQIQEGTGEPDPNFKAPRFPFEGVEIYKNPKNKFVVFQCHFTANPKKRDPNYIDQIKSSMPTSQFQREYNLQWITFAGQAVYPDWNKNEHGSKEPLKPEFGLPLLLGVDQGLNAAVVVAQQQGERLVVLREILCSNMGAERFTENVCRILAVEYPEWRDYEKDYRVFMDPAGFDRKDTDERTYASVWTKKGFRPAPGAKNWEPRRSAVEYFLNTRKKDGPLLLVDLAKCQMLVSGFEGGYRYSERDMDIEPDKIRAVKDAYSHVADALQYLASGLKKTQKTVRASIPDQHYSWGRRKQVGGLWRNLK